MADLVRAVAALRIRGENLVPAEISALMGSEPTTAWAKGDAHTSRGHTRMSGFGLWQLQAEGTEPADLDAQVTAVLGRLTTDESVWTQLRNAYDVDLICAWFMKNGNEGMLVAPETMSLLGARGILLDIDLYAVESD